jgi:hypothetical protein
MRTWNPATPGTSLFSVVPERFAVRLNRKRTSEPPPPKSRHVSSRLGRGMASGCSVTHTRKIPQDKTAGWPKGASSWFEWARRHHRSKSHQDMHLLRWNVQTISMHIGIKPRRFHARFEPRSMRTCKPAALMHRLHVIDLLRRETIREVRTAGHARVGNNENRASSCLA